jgi:hypothetical protein
MRQRCYVCFLLLNLLICTRLCKDENTMFVFTSERSKLLLDTTCTDGYTAQQPINLYLFSCTLCIVSMYLGPIAALNPLSQPQQARVATLHFVDSRALTADAVYSHRVSFQVPPSSHAFLSSNIPLIGQLRNTFHLLNPSLRAHECYHEPCSGGILGSPRPTCRYASTCDVLTE